MAQHQVVEQRGVLTNSDFLRLWTGQSISQLGTQLSLLAIPVTAAVFLRASAWEMGLLATMGVAPVLVFSLIAGAWIDRQSRRRVLIVTDVTRAATLTLVPVLYFAGALAFWHLYVIAFVVGTASVFFDIAYQAYLPRLVDRVNLVDANSKLELSRSAASIAGPSVAGGLLTLLAAPFVVLFDAVTYLVSAVFVATIRRPEPIAAAIAPGRRIFSDVTVGVRYVASQSTLRALTVATACSNLFSSMGFALYYLFALGDLRLTPGDIGIIFALGNGGFLLASLVARRVAERFGMARTLVTCLFGAALFATIVPLATPALAFPLLAISKFGGALCTVLYNVNQISLRQAITPDEMQGRVSGAVRFVVWGSQPIGFLAGGALGSWTDLRLAFLFASLCMFAAVPILMRSSLRPPLLTEVSA